MSEAPSPDLTPEPAAESPARRAQIGEDWAATIVGLALLALVLLGVIGKGIVP